MSLKADHLFVLFFFFFIILLANSMTARSQLCELKTNIPCSMSNCEMCNEFCWSELRAESGDCVSDILGPQCLCIIDCD
ncbi:hypothetical protein ACOSP7_015206 [Xanthoceras sorbifolium]